MSAARFEAFLTRLYVDQRARARFLADPRGEALKAGLTAKEVEDVVKIDRVGLELFTASLERKRAGMFARRVG